MTSVAKTQEHLRCVNGKRTKFITDRDTWCDVTVLEFTMWRCSRKTHNMMLQYKDTLCDAEVKNKCDAAVQKHNVTLLYKDTHCDAKVQRYTMWRYSTRILCDTAVKGHTVLCCSTKTHNVILKYNDTQSYAAVKDTQYDASLRLHSVLLQYKATQCGSAVQVYTVWCCSQGYTVWCCSAGYTLWCCSTRIHNVTVQDTDTHGITTQLISRFACLNHRESKCSK
jgi:isochorismate hydrolase